MTIGMESNRLSNNQIEYTQAQANIRKSLMRFAEEYSDKYTVGSLIQVNLFDAWIFFRESRNIPLQIVSTAHITRELLDSFGKHLGKEKNKQHTKTIQVDSSIDTIEQNR